MKKLLLILFVFAAFSATAQKVDTVKNAIQVVPKLINAIKDDTVYQVHIKVLDLNVNDTVSGCNTYIQFYDRKGKRVGQENVFIPAEIVNKWGTDDSILNVYVLSQIKLKKR